eukprot:scaffold48962_cov58-Phaeocystis_antarctica.AAC.4
MPSMSVILEVSKLSGWLNAAAFCRVDRRAHTVRGARCGPQEARKVAGSTAGHAMCRGELDPAQSWGRAREGAHEEHVAHARDARGVKVQLLVEHHGALPRVERRARTMWGKVEGRGAGQGTRGAHVEHAFHVCDAGSVPVGYIRVEAPCRIPVSRISVVRREKLAHVRDGRDLPAGDGAVRRSSGSRVSVELLDRRHQGGLGRESGRAGPRTPARAVSSGGEGRGARPRATNEQLVGVGQGACALPRVDRRA